MFPSAHARTALGHHAFAVGHRVASTVVLHSWTAADAEALADLCADGEIVRWTRVPAGYDLAAARARLTERVPDGQLRLAMLAGDVIVGAIDLREVEPHRAEVGYLAHRAHRRRGYATEAVRLLTAHGHATYQRIAILIDPDNPASSAVAARAGDVLEGTLRAYRIAPPFSGDRRMWEPPNGLTRGQSAL